MHKYYFYRLLRFFRLISAKKFKRKFPPDYKTVAKSGYFDENWYLRQNPDVKSAGVDPVTHYLQHGWKEGRKPSEKFDGPLYQMLYPDIAAAAVNPLVHYLKHGRKEGRLFEISTETAGLQSHRRQIETIRKSPLFNAEWYRQQYDIQSDDPAEHYLNRGWQHGFNPSEDFDGNFYLDFYDDVRRAKINPLLHYELYGRQKRMTAGRKCCLDILFITDCRPEDGVYIWRCDFMMKLFNKNGFSVAAESLSAMSENFLTRLNSAGTVIFSRPTTCGTDAGIIKVLLKTHKKFIIDLDDLLIADYSAYSGCYKSNGISYENVLSYNLMASSSFEYAELMFVSTPLLAKAVQTAFNVPALVLPNVIDRRFLSLKKPASSEKLRILYPTGSITHDYDVSTIYTDLLNIMLKYPDVSLTVLGRSSLQNSLKIFGDRVRTEPYGSFANMLKVYAQHDLVLVPLDNNPFNNAKSNIKYIEAGAVGTPVLASDVAEFRTVIKDGVNGFLFHDDFYEKFVRIYKNRRHLEAVGRRAYQDVRKKHCTEIKLSQTIKEAVC